MVPEAPNGRDNRALSSAPSFGSELNQSSSASYLVDLVRRDPKRFIDMLAQR